MARIKILTSNKTKARLQTPKIELQELTKEICKMFTEIFDEHWKIKHTNKNFILKQFINNRELI